MDGKTEGRLHNIAHSAWLTGKTWEVTAWLLCNQDVTEINVKNRTLLPVKVSELIKEMIFSMFVAATALSPDEFIHFVSGRGSVGAVRLDEWDLKSHLSDRADERGKFSTCRQAERRWWQQGSPHPGEVRSPEVLWRNGFQGAPLCTQTTKMEESGDASRSTSETKWETQLRGRQGADKEGRKFEIECRYRQKRQDMAHQQRSKSSVFTYLPTSRVIF